jgi:hypothetical protein
MLWQNLRNQRVHQSLQVLLDVSGLPPPAFWKYRSWYPCSWAIQTGSFVMNCCNSSGPLSLSSFCACTWLQLQIRMRRDVTRSNRKFSWADSLDRTSKPIYCAVSSSYLVENSRSYEFNYILIKRSLAVGLRLNEGKIRNSGSINFFIIRLLSPSKKFSMFGWPLILLWSAEGKQGPRCHMRKENIFLPFSLDR